ncbi:hypothetical protein PSCICN_49320 [Pseudomonas cichorii]|nr:hypothetical protein PSCICN_49320 [Pseudomonas cichorii]
MIQGIQALVGGALAATTSLQATHFQRLKPGCRGQGPWDPSLETDFYYSLIFGTLRGAMKNIQVRAMKYIAGIMVNSTL